jgi:hypothetical protein
VFCQDSRSDKAVATVVAGAYDDHDGTYGPIRGDGGGYRTAGALHQHRPRRARCDRELIGPRHLGSREQFNHRP